MSKRLGCCAVQAADAQKEAAVRSAIADGWQRELQRLEAQLLDLQHELRRQREQVGWQTAPGVLLTSCAGTGVVGPVPSGALCKCVAADASALHRLCSFVRKGYGNCSLAVSGSRWISKQHG